MEPTEKFATDSRPVRLWEVTRLTVWTLTFLLRSTTDALDHKGSRNA